jgi:hypothetical protein
MFNAIKTNPLDFVKMLLAVDNDNSYFTSHYYQYMHHWTRPYSSDLFSDSHIIIRFNAFVRLFSFGFFQVHNVFINFISLLGLTFMYKAFKPFLQTKEKALFYVVFLIPSVLFWGSGLLKESIIFFALGLIMFNLFNITKQFKITYLILIIFAGTLLIYTKFYLLIALFIPILGYLINYFLKFKKASYGYLVSSLVFFVLIKVAPLINENLDFVFQIANKQQTFSRFIEAVPTNSGFLLPHLSDGISIITNVPNALLNTLIRPYLWECNSLFVCLSAFENAFIICCFFLAIYYRKKVNSLNKNIIIFNLIFVFCLFTLIGLTTPVFGAIVRYKIPGIILLFISLLIIIDIQKIKSKHSLLNKIL